MQLTHILDRIHPLPENAKADILSSSKEISKSKNHILLKADKIENNIYFIKKGIVRAYLEHDGDEITFWFGQEGDFILSMKSYIENSKSYENIILLEDCELYEISIKNLDHLYQTNIEIANWGRKLAEQELVKIEQRFISRQLQTAAERYKNLIENSPELLQRVQLGHIASYLGITQVSLSRIRADFK